MHIYIWMWEDTIPLMVGLMPIRTKTSALQRKLEKERDRTNYKGSNYNYYSNYSL